MILERRNAQKVELDVKQKGLYLPEKGLLFLLPACCGRNYAVGAGAGGATEIACAFGYQRIGRRFDPVRVRPRSCSGQSGCARLKIGDEVVFERAAMPVTIRVESGAGLAVRSACSLAAQSVT